MESYLTSLRALYRKQKTLESELVQNKESLQEKIEGEYKLMVSDLRQSKERVLELVEGMFTETAAKLKVSTDETKDLIRDVKQLKDKLTEAKVGKKPKEAAAKGTDFGTRVKEPRKSKITTEESEDEKEHEKHTKTSKTTRSDDMRLKLKRKNAFLEMLDLSTEDLYPCSKSVKRLDLIPNANRTKSSEPGSIKSYGIYNIKSESDLKTCDINCICCIEDDQMVLVDTNNECLKLLDRELNMVKGTENVRSPPFSISQLHDRNYVLTDTDGGLRYIFNTRGYIYTGKSFSSGIRNWSVISDKSAVYVLCENRKNPSYTLRWYDFNGGSPGSTQLQGQYMCFDSTGSQLYVTRGITEFNKSDDVHVLASKQGRFCKKFEESFYFSSPLLKTPCGVVVDENNQVYVCGFESRNVLQFDRNGKQVGIVLECDELLHGAKSLGYDKKNHRLIIAGNTDKIQIINLKRC